MVEVIINYIGVHPFLSLLWLMLASTVCLNILTAIGCAIGKSEYISLVTNDNVCYEDYGLFDAAYILLNIFGIVIGTKLYLALKDISDDKVLIKRRCISVLILLFFTWCVYSWANPTSIIKTEYTYYTSKISHDYKILFISDSHYGAVQNTSVLNRFISEISSVDADIVILGGDIVERGTSYDNMLKVFEMFGNIQSKYGVYYVYGNHDSEVYNRTHICTEEDFKRILSDNGITLLCDNVYSLGDILLIGRDNISRCSFYERHNISDLIDDKDNESYKIVVDHQPIEMDTNSSSGIDMQISGHTHAGQIFPVNLLLYILHSPIYGQYVYDGMNLVVSSGQGVGSYACRNLKHCEYVVINLVKEE